MRVGPLDPCRSLPALIAPSRPGHDALEALLRWLREEPDAPQSALHRHGALLLRGFPVTGPADFEQVCRTMAGDLMRYVGGDSPRRSVTRGVYTSTEYPAALEIPLHSEMTYMARWPRRVFFHCATAPASGGETPIADTRAVLARIAPATRERFERLGAMYIQNLPHRTDSRTLKAWPETFETEDRAQVERICRDAGMEFEWTERGLRTRAVRPAIVEHPATHEHAWVSQVDQWHVAGGSVKHIGAARTADDDAPSHGRYGDGTPIPVETVREIKAAYRAGEVTFPWQAGDVLVLDNLLAAHGRKPFTGDRRILVALS